MKKLLLLCFVLLTNSVLSQNLDVAYKKSCTVVIPTESNLKQLSKLNEEEFTAIMNKNNYREDLEFSTHRRKAFTNGNLDPILLNCFSTIYYDLLNSSVEFVIAIDMLYPENSITNLVRQLKPIYETTTSDGYDVFRDKDYLVAIKSDDKFYRVLIKAN